MRDYIEEFLVELSNLPEFGSVCKIQMNSRSVSGASPLHIAVIRGETQLVALLVLYGADLDAQDRAGWTAIDLAREHGHSDIEDLLVRALSKPPISGS